MRDASAGTAAASSTGRSCRGSPPPTEPDQDEAEDVESGEEEAPPPAEPEMSTHATHEQEVLAAFGKLQARLARMGRDSRRELTLMLLSRLQQAL